MKGPGLGLGGPGLGLGLGAEVKKFGAPSAHLCFDFLRTQQQKNSTRLRRICLAMEHVRKMEGPELGLGGPGLGLGLGGPGLGLGCLGLGSGFPC